MITKILVGLALVMVAFVVVVAMRPSRFRVVRMATMSAPPSVVFAQVNDFHNWEAWSPWARLDPSMKITYEGAPAGVGAAYTWKGNGNVGEGRSTIIESHPNDLVQIKLEFVRPFAGTNTAEFIFKPVGDQTAVTWSLEGEYNFVTKAMGLFMNMDKMIGGQFESGLAQMKSIVEARAAESAVPPNSASGSLTD